MRCSRARFAAIVIALSLPSTAHPQQLRGDKQSFRTLATQELSRRNLENALRVAQQCLAQYPKDKECAKLAMAARDRLVLQLSTSLNNVPKENLPEIEALLTRLVEYQDSPEFRQKLSQTQEGRREIQGSAQRYVDALHSGVMQPLPKELHTYARYLPELASVEGEAVAHMALATADEAEGRGAFNEAIEALSSYDHPEVTLKLTALKERAASTLAASVDALLASKSVVDLVKAFDTFEQVGPALPKDRGLVILAQLERAAVEIVRPLVPPTSDSESQAAIARVIQTKLSDSAAARFPWEQVTGTAPGILASIRVGAPEACPGLIESGITSQVEKNLPIPLRVGTPARLSVELQDIDCTVDTQVVGEEPVNSTYIASYQQVTNPEYVQLQQQLQVAQTNLSNIRTQNALNPPANAWAGVAAGIAEGAAVAGVNNIYRKLQGTAPFLSEPVVLAYTPYRYLAVRVAKMTATFSVSDSATGFADALTIGGTAESKGDGIRAVLAADRGGLANRDPALTAPEALIAQALQSILTRVQEAAQGFGSRAMLQRAAAASRTKDGGMVAVGTILYAQDLSPSMPELAQFAASFNQVAVTPPEKLASLSVDPKAFGGPTLPTAKAAAGRAAPPARGRSARATMLESKLDAVVTISTGASEGSGFFIGNSGLVVTNAHVVEGASKIVVRTRAKETFLATVVKLSLADDLALLQVRGAAVTGLRLGDSESAEVGSDVIAVGSPLGLEGTVTRGIVSALRRLGDVPLIQIDAAINPGNSGGPLLSESGDVIGVNSMKLRPQSAEALGFAISANHVKAVFAQFLKP